MSIISQIVPDWWPRRVVSRWISPRIVHRGQIRGNGELRGVKPWLRGFPCKPPQNSSHGPRDTRISPDPDGPPPLERQSREEKFKMPLTARSQSFELYVASKVILLSWPNHVLTEPPLSIVIVVCTAEFFLSPTQSTSMSAAKSPTPESRFQSRLASGPREETLEANGSAPGLQGAPRTFPCGSDRLIFKIYAPFRREGAIHPS
jgi:hypothetical protein